MIPVPSGTPNAALLKRAMAATQSEGPPHPARPTDGRFPISVTGREDGWTDEQAAAFAVVVYTMLEEAPTDVHHGDCFGVDRQAHAFFLNNFPEAWIHVHPPIIDVKRAWCSGPHVHIYEPRDYDVRNVHIAQRGKALIAVPETGYEKLRSGTWQTARLFTLLNRLRGVSRPIYVIRPDGMIQTEWQSELVGTQIKVEEETAYRLFGK
jgi:hypothetical protein